MALNQAQAQQGNIAKADTAVKTVGLFLVKNKARIANALPSNLTPDRMLSIVMTEIRKVPALAECDQASLFGAVIQASQLGLEIGSHLGHCYLIPFKNKQKGITECQFIVGYRGMIDLARRSGQIISLQAHAVYENDEFDFAYGLEERLDHVPARSDKGDMIAVYAVAKLVGGGHQIEVMWKSDVDLVAKSFGPWKDHYEEMAKKTVIRRLFKYLPVSIELQTAVSQDEKAESDVSQDNSSIIDVDFDIAPHDQGGTTSIKQQPNQPKPTKGNFMSNTNLAVVVTEETISDLCHVDMTPAVVTADLSKANAMLDDYLVKYDVIVTEDGVKGAKKDAAELRKVAKHVDGMRKDFEKQVMGNWPEQSESIKAIVTRLTDTAKAIADQAKKFEEQRLVDIRDALIDTLNANRNVESVDDEFRTSSIDDLVKLGAMTEKGSITAATVSKIKQLVSNEKALQMQTEMRLLKLENESYRAGLAAPLTRAHVETFLFADDTTYQSRLEAMLESEKERQAVAERKVREQVQAEQPKAEALPATNEAMESMVADMVSNSMLEEPAVEPVSNEQINHVEPTIEKQIEFAYGPLDAISKASFIKTTRSAIEAIAITEIPEGNIGIWTSEGLIVEIIRHASPKQ